MAEGSAESKSQIPPMPDILNTQQLSGWMKVRTVRAPKGYEEMKHPDGTFFNLDEQIDAYIKQVVAVIEFMKQRNDPREAYEDTKQGILSYTLPENPTSADK